MVDRQGQSGWQAVVAGFADQIFSSGSNVLMLLAVARVSEVEQFGVVGLLMTILTMGLNIVRGGINTPILLLGGASKPDLFGEIRAGLFVSLLAGTLIGGSLLLVGWNLGVLTLALPLALSAPVVLTQDVHRYASMTIDQGRSAVLFDGLWAALSLAAFASTFILHIGPMMVLWIWLSGAAASWLGLLITSTLWPSPTRVRRWWERGRPDRLRYLTDAALGAGPAVAVAALVTILTGPEATAAIRGAGTVMGPLSLVMSAIPLAVIPRAIRYGHTSKENWRLLRRMAIAMSIFALLLGVSMSAAPTKLGQLLLGESWTRTAPLLPFTGLEYAALAWLYCSWALFRATGRSRLLLRTRLCHVLITSALSLSFAAWFLTALGAAVGLALGAVASAAIMVFVRRCATSGAR